MSLRVNKSNKKSLYFTMGIEDGRVIPTLPLTNTAVIGAGNDESCNGAMNIVMESIMKECRPESIRVWEVLKRRFDVLKDYPNRVVNNFDFRLSSDNSFPFVQETIIRTFYWCYMSRIKSPVSYEWTPTVLVIRDLNCLLDGRRKDDTVVIMLKELLKMGKGVNMFIIFSVTNSGNYIFDELMSYCDNRIMLHNAGLNDSSLTASMTTNKYFYKDVDLHVYNKNDYRQLMKSRKRIDTSMSMEEVAGYVPDMLNFEAIMERDDATSSEVFADYIIHCWKLNKFDSLTEYLVKFPPAMTEGILAREVYEKFLDKKDKNVHMAYLVEMMYNNFK